MPNFKDYIQSQKDKLNSKNFNNVKTVSTIIFIVLLMFFIVCKVDKKEETKEAINNEIIENEVNNQEETIESEPEVEEVKNMNHVYLSMDGEGYNVYAPVSGCSGYRYGPSIIYYDDGSADAWFAANANNVEWDWITYRHFDGESWGREKIVLMPSGGAYDFHSVCDPGVIYFNGYYYLGYTSTIVDTNGGINNNVFVARSVNPDGPFEKWNGEGWGGLPKPIVYYNEEDSAWGAGEVSFTIKDDRLFVYYSWICPHANDTRVMVGDLSENWPNTLQYETRCFKHGNGQDSVDVVYVEEIDKFLAFSTIFRFTDQSGICIYESDNGMKFNLASIVRENVSMHCHNLGISKKPNGHISLNDNLFVGYAYASSENSRGVWATRLQNIKLEPYEGNLDVFEDSATPIKRYNINTSYGNAYMSGISVDKKVVSTYIDNNVSIRPIYYDYYHGKHQLDDSIDYSYDEEYIDIVNNTIIPKEAGKVVVDMSYNDLHSSFTVLILEDKYQGDDHPEVIDFKPIEDNIVVNLDSEHSKCLTSYVEFENGTWGEIYNCDTSKYAIINNGVDPYNVDIKYESANPKIVEILDNGVIEPHKKGNTSVKVTITGDKSYTVNIKVN